MQHKSDSKNTARLVQGHNPVSKPLMVYLKHDAEQRARAAASGVERRLEHTTLNLKPITPPSWVRERMDAYRSIPSLVR